jgi:zinc protease
VYDLPLDYFADYRQSIAAVTKEEVDRAAREHLDPAKFTLAIVGSGDTIIDPLAALNAGEVHRHVAPE